METPNRLFSPDRPEDGDFEPKGFVRMVIGRFNRFSKVDPASVFPPESPYRIIIFETKEEDSDEDDYRDFHEPMAKSVGVAFN